MTCSWIIGTAAPATNDMPTYNTPIDVHCGKWWLRSVGILSPVTKIYKPEQINVIKLT